MSSLKVFKKYLLLSFLLLPSTTYSMFNYLTLPSRVFSSLGVLLPIPLTFYVERSIIREYTHPSPKATNFVREALSKETAELREIPIKLHPKQSLCPAYAGHGNILLAQHPCLSPIQLALNEVNPELFSSNDALARIKAGLETDDCSCKDIRSVLDSFTLLDIETIVQLRNFVDRQCNQNDEFQDIRNKIDQAITTYRAIIQHEAGHIKHSKEATAVVILAPILSSLVVSCGLYYLHVTNPGSCWDCLATLVGSLYLDRFNPLPFLYKRFAEFRADDNIENNPKTLRGFQSHLQKLLVYETLKDNLNALQGKKTWLRFLQSWKNTHPTSKSRIERIDKRLAHLESSNKIS